MEKNYRIEMRIYEEETDEVVANINEPLYSNKDEVLRQANRLQERFDRFVEIELESNRQVSNDKVAE